MALPYSKARSAKQASARIGEMIDGALAAAIAEVQPALLKRANNVAERMRQLAETSRHTGALINSITVTPGGQQTPRYSQPGGNQVVPVNQVAITAGNASTRYVHLVEYGTATAPAQPFFWPAFRLERKRALAAIKRDIAKAVRNGAKRGA